MTFFNININFSIEITKSVLKRMLKFSKLIFKKLENRYYKSDTLICNFHKLGM